MKTFIFMLRKNMLFKKILIIFQYIFISLYTFSLPSFSGRNTFNLISYFFMGCLVILAIISTIIYSKFRFHWYLLIIPAFSIWAFVGTAIYSHSFRGWFSLILMSITLFTFYFSFIFINNIKCVLKTIVFSLLLFCVYFFVIYYKDILNYKNFVGDSFRLGDYFDNVNHIGSYLIIGFAISIYLTFFFVKKRELLYSLASLCFAFVGFTTGSRTFIISIIASLLVILFMKFKKRKIILLISIVSSILVFAALINMPFLSVLKKRMFGFFGTFVTGEASETSSIQRYLWQIYGVHLGSKQLITGYGYNGFAIYSGVGTYAHANYSELLSNYGLIGLLLFYGAIAYMFVLAVKSNSGQFNIIIIFASLFFVNSFLMVYYYDKATYLMLAIMYYVVDSETKKRELLSNYYYCINI